MQSQKNLGGKVGKPIGPFKTALAAWDYVDHGLRLGLKSVEDLEVFMTKKRKNGTRVAPIYLSGY